MITVYFININTLPNDLVFNELLNKLDISTKEKILLYQSRHEQLVRIYGKYLVNKLLFRYKKNNVFSLRDLQYNQWGKPFFNTDFYFSISHSGSMVICAGVEGAKIGVDIEQQKGRDISNMQDYFTASEWDKISSAGHDNTEFYKIWVRKEACLKAIGKGLLLSLHEIDVCNDVVMLDNSRWVLHDLQIRTGYAACIATDKQNEGIIIEEVDINTLIDQQ